MPETKESLLIFGGGPLQESIISLSKEMGLLAVVIDPNPKASGASLADEFHVVGGSDFEETCRLIEEHAVRGIVTAATDKPLRMMAAVAANFDFPFFSERTAEISTDKFLMKEAFLKQGVPCAKGRRISTLDEDFRFPVVVKPRDNSGSRGVTVCQTLEELNVGLRVALDQTKADDVLVEEFIDGREYSIEAIHIGAESRVVQVTAKITTEPPHSVELGHVQPAEISDDVAGKFSELVEDVAQALDFKDCVSHTEVKINEDGIFVIESSPRLGGDFITSHLTPLSTGTNIERSLIEIALGREVGFGANLERSSGVFYFNFTPGRIVKSTEVINNLSKNEGVVELSFDLKPGDSVPEITNSIDRYGHFIVSADNVEEINEIVDLVNGQAEQIFED